MRCFAGKIFAKAKSRAQHFMLGMDPKRHVFDDKPLDRETPLGLLHFVRTAHLNVAGSSCSSESTQFGQRMLRETPPATSGIGAHLSLWLVTDRSHLILSHRPRRCSRFSAQDFSRNNSADIVCIDAGSTCGNACATSATQLDSLRAKRKQSGIQTQRHRDLSAFPATRDAASFCADLLLRHRLRRQNHSALFRQQAAWSIDPTAPVPADLPGCAWSDWTRRLNPTELERSGGKAAPLIGHRNQGCEADPT